MIDFLLIPFIVYSSRSDQLKADTSSFLTHSFNHFSSNKLPRPKILLLNQENEYICTASTDISDKTFTNFAKIKSDIGCQSINIVKCIFKSISIPENLQPDDALSIIHTTNNDLFIENCEFTECSSQSKISTDNIICHAIYVGENTNHDIIISNSVFSNNGYSTDPDGTVILIHNSKNVQISFTMFESKERTASGIQIFNTNIVNFTFNTFLKMTGQTNQNGGAISIQFSDNISISNCIFDSNKLQQKISSQTDPIEIRGSAFYVNLNRFFLFTNNTVKKHDTFLNSVVTFNKKDDQELNEIVIKSSNFNKNKYSKSFEGSGIGFLSESFVELKLTFIDCLFDENGDSNTNGIVEAAGVFGWSKERSSVSFVNCCFEKNFVPSSSSLISIKNGFFLSFDDCTIKETVNYCFVKFSPLSNGQSEIDEINVKMTNTSITNTDTSSRIEKDLISIENDSNFNSNLIINDCTFSDISLNSNNFIIHTKSNLNSICLTNSTITFTDQAKGSNLMKFENSNINFLNINGCTFEKSLYAICSEITVKDTAISNCTFTDCVSNSAVIQIKSDHFLFENSDIIFTSHSNGACSMGIIVSDSVTAVINNTNFKNCFGQEDGIAIRCISQNLDQTSMTVNSCTFSECTPEKSNVYTNNRQVNFVNNTISSDAASNNLNGLFVNYMCRLFIDECTFTRCTYSSSHGSSIKYYPTVYDENIDESIIVQNCYFTECAGYASVASIYPFVSRPKFFNMTISKAYHNFNIIVEMQSSSSSSINADEVILQNVSFIDSHPVSNTAAAGGGGCGFSYKTTISNSDTVSFINCRFEDNYYQGQESFGGGAICFQDSSCSNFNVKISSCTFLNCYTPMNNGGTIAITTEKSVSIEDCYFEKCRIESTEFYDYKGGAIYVNQSSDEENPFYLINTTFNGTSSCSDFSAVYFECSKCSEFIVDGCDFINCKSKCYQKLPYNIISCPLNVSQFECSNTNFIFDEKSTANPRAVKIECPSFQFNNCSFIRCGSKYVDQGGALFYNGTSQYETVTLDVCYFDECDATNSASFKFLFKSAVYPSFRNVTINNTCADYNIYISYKTMYRGSILFNGFKFINNENSLEGGGSGIWVSNYNDEFYSLSIYLIFTNCEFINNYTPQNGGAFGVGINEKIEPTQLSFSSCEFIGNHCNGTDGGGALWIRSSISCTIYGCNFRDNYASELAGSNGGALYLSFTSNMVFMTINSCSFINNSCPHSNSKGHAIYATLLYARMEVSYCNLTDNGLGNENINSVIYSRSELGVIESRIEFTDKEKSFSRAIYSGASSDLTFRGNFIANCSIAEGSGGAILYESIRNRVSGRIEIIENTFINNTSKEKGTEIYIYFMESPNIINYNNTFINESSGLELIFIKFNQYDTISTYYDRFYFINCDFNNKHFISKSPFDEYEMMYETLILSGCRYISCKNIPMFFSNIYSLKLSDCIFEGNTNEDRFITIDNVEDKLTIDNCEFRSNFIKRINLVDDDDFALIKITKVGEFYMKNCFVNNSGKIFIDEWIQKIVVLNSSLGNSIDGFIYSPDKTPNDFVSNAFQFEDVVFDGCSNRACFLTVLNDINISNITVKNCQNFNENHLPTFHLDIRNDQINEFTFDHFTFENNKFNNINNNGGGIGLAIDLSAKDDEIFIDFVDCNFVSNNAENYGGAYSFIESDEKTTFLSFDNCYFYGNSCNKLKGGALYLSVKNASINNCVFESNSKYSLCAENCDKPISVINSTFSNNNEFALSFSDCKSIVLLSDCLFTSDKNHNYAVSCILTNNFIVENVSINGSGGFLIEPNLTSSGQFSLTKTTIRNSNTGLFYRQSNEHHLINVVDCTFCSLKNAFVFYLTNTNHVIRNNTICDCMNCDDKRSTIEITIESTMNLLFDEFIFDNNSCSQQEEKTAGFGGGIGLNVFTSSKEKTAKLEFKNCIFSSNKNNNIDGNGGSFYYSASNNITLSRLSFDTCNFTHNFASQKGGSLYIENDHPLSIQNCWFMVNHAQIDGGAVYVINRADLTIDSCHFINNSAILTSSSSSLIPTDSLVVFGRSNVVVSNCFFIKLSYAEEESNVQSFFSLSKNRMSATTIVVKNSIYSVINPSKSCIAIQSPNTVGTISIDNTTFTHFYLDNRSKIISHKHKEKISRMSNSYARANQSINYVHIYIKKDLKGKISIGNSCFDTDSLYSFDGEKIGYIDDSQEPNKQLISQSGNEVGSYECYHPPIIDELIDQNFFAKPTSPPKKKDSMKKELLIGLVVAAFSVVIIVVIVIVIVFVHKKKKKEEEEKNRKEKEKTGKEMTEELEAITSKLAFPTQVVTQENPLFTYANMTRVEDKNEFEEDFEKVQTTKE